MARKDKQKEIKPMSLEKAEKKHSEVVSATNMAKQEVETIESNKVGLEKTIKGLLKRKETLETDITELSVEKTTKAINLNDLKEKERVQDAKVHALDVLIEEKQKLLSDADKDTLRVLRTEIETLETQKKTAEIKALKAKEDQLVVEQNVIDANKKLQESQDDLASANKQLADIRDAQIPLLISKKDALEREIRDLDIQKVQRAADMAVSKGAKMELTRAATRLTEVQEEIRQAEMKRDNVKESYKTESEDLASKIERSLEIEKAIDKKIKDYKRMTNKAQTEAIVEEKINKEEAPQ